MKDVFYVHCVLFLGNDMQSIVGFILLWSCQHHTKATFFILVHFRQVSKFFWILRYLCKNEDQNKNSSNFDQLMIPNV